MGLSLSFKFKNVADQFVWMFSSVYGPTCACDWWIMWDELSEVQSWWDVPCCLGCDLNVVRLPLEKWVLRILLF